MTLHIISAGAAQMLINEIAPAFSSMAGDNIDAVFGSAGSMKERLLSGAPCDILIITSALMNEVSAAGHVLPETIQSIGSTSIGIAVPAGGARPDISSPAALKASLLAAEGIYFADAQRGTAGRHVMTVIQRLNILTDVQDALKQYSSGPAAMAGLAKSTKKNAVGCTQISEILYTKNIELVGPLPSKLGLTTQYDIAICKSGNNMALAKKLVEALTSTSSEETRTRCGLNMPPGALQCPTAMGARSA